MNQYELIIEHAEAAEVVGPNNRNLKALQAHFPKLKIAHRGLQVFVQGDKSEFQAFRAKFDQLIRHVAHYGAISEQALFQLIHHHENTVTEPVPSNDIILHGNGGKIIRARTPNQKRMVELMQENDILFAIGPAGTGKTYTAVALAVKALKNREIKRIILARPAVEAGESLGFLPGDMKEKIDPYLRPLYDALDDMIPPEKLAQYLENRTIEIAPMAFMRGRTLDHAYVILDESQNATTMQLKMFLTRMGPHAKFIITGDLTQVDLPPKQQSGLIHAVHTLKNIQGIHFQYLDMSDVVRHKLVREIIKAYDSASDKLHHQQTEKKQG